MFKSDETTQACAEFVLIQDLVPKDHLLRKVNAAIDFSFIREKTRDLYCADNGRPCVDPVVLFKMLFLGYLFGIRSERRLVEEIKVNIAYRWFLGLKLTDPVPHHSTISQNRRRRFNGTDIFQEIFDEMVLFAIENEMIDGVELFSDSTFLKANANRGKYVKKEVEGSTKAYVKELNKAIDEDRKMRGKKPLKKKESEEEKKEIRVSTTDPDSGYMVRDGKPEGFFYLDHRTTDGKLNLITDVFVSP
jgi:transposase